MNYMPSVPPAIMNHYTDGTPSRKAQQFPPNLAANLSPEIEKKMLLWLMSKYWWPQIQERMPFERMWDKLLEMSRIQMPTDQLFSNTRHDASRVKNEADQSNRDKARVSDSVIHDSIQRLTDITYFIAFKEGLPAQFSIPEYIRQPHSTQEYRPLKDRIAAGNAILQWNSDNQNVKRQSLIAYRHHFTYGCAFVMSDFNFRVEMINRQDNMGNLIPVPEITEIGTTFEPISIRKLWLNWRLPVYEMEKQPCPFFFEETPRFQVMQNPYNPQTNPFGYLNLDRLTRGEYIYQGQAMESVVAALQKTFASTEENGITTGAVSQLLEPKHSVEAKWTSFPVMPFDPQTGEFETRADGSDIPYNRFILETFGPNIHSGSQVILRLQENYFPKRRLPLYASSHMPDLDSGAYAPTIGQILYNHYKEICLCMEQFLENKDQINDPAAWVQTSSPARNTDLNAKGAKIPVNGPNDFGWKSVIDATSSTVAMLQLLREGAQTTGKVVDAIMGKAMGSRTSATEAQNAFQASMSAITTDIDMITHDLHGAYAQRTWDYTGAWFDPDLLQHITGQFGFMISPEDMWINVGLTTNVGSTYVEKIVKQQNTRYVLEASRMEQGLNRAELWTQLLDSMGFDGGSIVDDQGREQQIQFATLQACQTYLGYPVLVDPDQDHQLAIRIKTAFIKDQTSVWNTNPSYAVNAQALVEQIKQHQFIFQLQQQMLLVQQQMMVAQAQLKVHNETPPPKEVASLQKGSAPANTAGQVAQQGGSAR